MAEIAEETNPHLKRYEQLESNAQLCAYFAKENGVDVFREFLRVTARPVPPRFWELSDEEKRRIYTREDYLEIAGELRARGLKKLARIVAEHAVTRLRHIDLCPYPPGSTGERSWLWMERQHAHLCPWCGQDRSPGMICDNGETCETRWQNLSARTPRPNVKS
jgi:hypothetical protein